MSLYSIHQDMVAQGYEIKDGKVVKKLDSKTTGEDTHTI
jgi:DNA-directed RNA polymerase subunit H (RpoH/RPB5)